MRIPLLALALSLAPVCARCDATADGEGPESIQLVELGGNPFGIAVSPTGGRLLVGNEDGLWEYALKPDGTIGRRQRGIKTESVVYRCAYAPGGQRIIYAMEDQVVLFDRNDWKTRTRVPVDGGRAWALDVLEDPPLAFVQWDRPCQTSVINYRQKPHLRGTIEPTQPGPWWPRGAMASPDGAYFFQIWRRAEESDTMARLDAMRDPLGAREPVWADLIADPWTCCLGPDPEHMMVISEANRELDIFDLRSGERHRWYFIETYDPLGIATSNDGYFVVIADYIGRRLHLISGHDLRGYIDPNFEIDREDVRHVELPTQHLPVCLALHPTLPIAYLGCQSRERAGPSQIDVVRMRIPGVEHPADQ